MTLAIAQICVDNILIHDWFALFVLFCLCTAVRWDSCVGYWGRATTHSLIGWWRLYPANPVLQWAAGERSDGANWGWGADRRVHTATGAAALLYECEQAFCIIIIIIIIISDFCCIINITQSLLDNVEYYCALNPVHWCCIIYMTFNDTFHFVCVCVYVFVVVGLCKQCVRRRTDMYGVDGS